MELLEIIFSGISLHNSTKMRRQVCKQWNGVLEDKRMWKEIVGKNVNNVLRNIVKLRNIESIKWIIRVFDVTVDDIQ